MTRKLFVGGLSWGTDDAQLKAAFATFGDVTDAKVILDVDTGRSRGFGFVTFTEDDACSRALTEMDGHELDGRSIRVNEAQEKPRASGDRGAPRGSRDGGGGPPRQRESSDRGGGGPPRSGGSPQHRSPDKRRGGGRPESKGQDRFARRRNAQDRRGSRRPTGDSSGSGDSGGFDEFDPDY